MEANDDRLVTGGTPTFSGSRTDSRPHWRGRVMPVPVQKVWFPRLRGRIADLLAPWHLDAYERAIWRISELSYAQAVAPYALGHYDRDPFDGRLLGMDMERMEDGPPRVE